MASYLESQLHKPQALTYHANQVKRLGRMSGVTVEIAQARLSVAGLEQNIFVAGINSSGHAFNAQQLALLNSWQVDVAPCQARGMQGAPHAEENIAAYLLDRGARGLRWSRAVVGEHLNTRRGSRSYVCYACQLMVKRAGGVIEEPF